MHSGMNLLEQVDDFWREALQLDIMRDLNAFQNKYADLVKRVGDQVSHLPEEEQDRLVRQAFDHNAEYIALAKQDKDALKVKLGVPLGLPASSALDQLD